MPSNSKGAHRRRPGGLRILLALVLVLLMAGLGVMQAAALPVYITDSGFQLDRDASHLTGATAKGADWDQVYNGGTTTKPTGAVAAQFIPMTTLEGPAVDKTFYDMGGSKDVNDITDWAWTENNIAPNKDEITNAYATAYKNAAGDTILFFGADRYAKNGDAMLGFWYLQDAVTTDMATHKFTGAHMPGDILVLANFSQGGDVAGIAVYRWDPTDTDNLASVGSGGDCATNPPSYVCATTNLVVTPSPWPFKTVTPDKDQTDDTMFPSVSFFEGGVNITQLYAQLGLTPDFGCFTSFLAETRSSTSTDAQLKDFALGSFNECSLSVTKTADTLSKVTDPVDYTINIKNTGGVTLYKDTINDPLLGGSLGAVGVNGVLTNTCSATLAPDATCTITARRTVQTGDPDPLINTVNVTYKGRADLTGVAVTGTAQASTNLFQPSVEVVKGGPSLAKFGDTVTYTFTITNKSSSDAPALKLDATNGVVDNKLGNLTALAAAATPTSCSTLAYNASCTFTKTYTIPNDAPNPLINTVTVLYHPDGFPNPIEDTDTHSLNLYAPNFTIEKTGTNLSKIGDPVTFNFKITNTSTGASAPNLQLVSISDNKLDGLLTAPDSMLARATTAGCDVLTAAEVCTFSVTVDVPQGASDPWVNTVTAVYKPAVTGSANITKTATHSTNLFTPAVQVEKSGPTLAKFGDTVTYSFTITNKSTDDAPALVLDSVVDDKLGDLKATAAAANPSCSTLAFNGTCTFTKTYTIPMEATTPLVNKVTVHYHPTGFPNDVSDDDTHSLNLFTASFTIDKSADTTLSKVGDAVNYTVVLTNTSTANTPALSCTLTDAKLGINKAINLAVGAADTTTKAYTVQANDPDPLPNTASATCSYVVGQSTVTLPAQQDTWSVNLFQPAVTVEKSGPTLAKFGDTVTYSFTITNTGSSDSPNLVLDSVSDDVLGTLTATAAAATPTSCSNLAVGVSCTFTKTYTIPNGATNPLVNKVTVHYHPAGFPNDIKDDDTHSLNLYTPNFTIAKSGDALSKIGDPATFTFTITNTSVGASAPSLELVSISDDKLGDLKALATTAGCDVLTAAEVCTFQKTITVPVGASDPWINTVTAIYKPAGTTSNITKTASHETNLFQPAVEVAKSANVAYAELGETVTYTFTITNKSSSDAPALKLDATNGVVDNKLGNLTAVAPASCATLAYNASCTFTKTHVVANTDADPLVNVVTVLYHPDGFPNPVSDDATASVDIIHPDFTVTKDCPPSEVPVNGSLNYKITVTNTGDVPLNFTLVDSKATLAPADQAFSLAVGASRVVEASYIVPAGVGEVTNVVTATATVPTNPYGAHAQIVKTATATCKVQTGATRTKGFWQTHYEYTAHVLSTHYNNGYAHPIPVGGIDLGWTKVTNADQAMGIFWASVSKCSNGDQRDKTCQAAIQASQQALAALLNWYGFDNAAPLPAGYSPAEIAAILKTGDITALRTLHAKLDAYNNSGDNVAFVDHDGATQGRADPKAARAAAEATIKFADCVYVNQYRPTP